MTDVLLRDARLTDVQAESLPAHPVSAVLPCQGEGSDLFFSERPSELEEAKTLCSGCSLAAECLAGALARSEPWGVWGGQILQDGAVIAAKRGRGRPRKHAA